MPVTTATAPTPSTATIGSTIYYVTQVNTTTGCESNPRTAITVTVNPVPVITGSSFVNPTNCGGSNGTITLSGLTPGVSYQVADGAEPHRSSTTAGATLFIVD